MMGSSSPKAQRTMGGTTFTSRTSQTIESFERMSVAFPTVLAQQKFFSKNRRVAMA
jgi:hypothetical protein